MATKDFEVQQIVRAYRKGLISEELFASQMAELGAAGSAEAFPISSRIEASLGICSARQRRANRW